MKVKTFIIDAFTDEPFKGNPAGVCLLDAPVDEGLMQSIANELNLSETAFLVAREGTTWSIRYFTPEVEVPFCGHATLASAKLILHHLKQPSATFITHHQLELSASAEGDELKMHFPVYKTVAYSPPSGLCEALGINHAISVGFAKELDMLVIEVEDKETLHSILPDFGKVRESTDALKEVVVTARSADDQYDFYSRCFCPWIGIDEDPVTGAAHSVLSKYWSDRLGKKEMTAYQASKRGGYMKLNLISDTQLEVRSRAVIVFEGVLNVPH